MLRKQVVHYYFNNIWVDNAIYLELYFKTINSLQRAYPRFQSQFAYANASDYSIY